MPMLRVVLTANVYVIRDIMIKMETQAILVESVYQVSGLE